MEIRKKYSREEQINRVGAERDPHPLTAEAKQAIIINIGHPRVTVDSVDRYANGMVITWEDALCQIMLDIAQDSIQSITGKRQPTYRPIYDRSKL